MKVFISYASEDRDVAEQIHLALLGDGHTTFFDRDSLPPAQDYHTQIRLAVEGSDAMVFLISPESVAAGSYALTELSYARRRWPHPKGSVLPVFVRAVDWSAVPNYLKSVTVLTPSGQIAAEVLAAIARLHQASASQSAHGTPSPAKHVRPAWWRSKWVAAATVLALISTAAVLIVRPNLLFDSDGKPPASGENVTRPPASVPSADKTEAPRRIEVRTSQPVTINADVDNMALPYSVSLDGKFLIRSLVDKRDTISSLSAGEHVLAWAFTHSTRGWRHTLSLEAGDRPPIVLDQKSESAGDTETSLGSVVLVVIDPAAVRRFDVRRGEQIILTATVGPMAAPYTVSLAGTVRIKSMTTHREVLADLPAGEHVLSWAFNHALKGWHHRLDLQIDGGSAVTLDEKSERNGDAGNSLGTAIIAVK